METQHRKWNVLDETLTCLESSIVRRNTWRMFSDPTLNSPI